MMRHHQVAKLDVLVKAAPPLTNVLASRHDSESKVQLFLIIIHIHQSFCTGLVHDRLAIWSARSVSGGDC